MELLNDKYHITIDKVYNPLRSQEPQPYEYVYNPGNYKEEDDHSAFLIMVETAIHTFCIEFIGFILSDPTHCAVLDGAKLMVLLNDELVTFDLETVSALNYTSIGHEIYFSLYAIPDGFLVHGELSILRLDRTFKEVWSFCGLDIWVIPDNDREPFQIIGDRIYLEDWEGFHYVLDLNGNQIFEKHPLPSLNI